MIIKVNIIQQIIEYYTDLWKTQIKEVLIRIKLDLRAVSCVTLYIF